ncbi:MAG: T9SS type A sorting domain-containing protein [Bacteroidetes bacterium]|nr:T9SS type A sorting domain-containing protein [Bacteroidota bacterium]
MKKFFLAAVLISVLFIFGRGIAATVTVTSNTNWSSLNVNSGDNVLVKSGATLTIDVSNALCSYITLSEYPGGGAGKLKFNSNSVLTLTSTTNSLILGANKAGNTGSLDMTLGGTMYIAGGINVVNLGSFTVGAGTIVYNGAAQTVYNTTYNNLTIAGSGTKTLSGEVSVSGNLTINSGAALSTGANSQNLKLGGNFTNNGTFTATASDIWFTGTANQNIDGFTTTGIVTMSKTSGTAALSGNINVDSLVINGIGGTLNLGSGLTHSVATILTRTNGTLDMSSSSLSVGGKIVGTGGTFTANNGTMIFNMSGAQTVPAMTFYNLTLSGSGVKTLSSGITVNNTLSIEGTATISGTAPTYGASSVLQYKGTSAQTVSAVEFPLTNGPNSLTINNTAGVSFPSSFSRTISGTLTLTSGALTIANDTLTVNGSISSGSGYFMGDSTSASMVIGGTGANLTLPQIQKGLKSLTINRANGVTLGADLTVNGNLIMTSGKLSTTSSYTVYFTTASANPTESANSYILGKAVMKQRTVGAGTIDFLNANIQGILNIGNVTITRTTGTNGIITSNGNSGIAANWNITSSVSNSRGVTFRWLPALDNNIVFNSGTLAQLFYNNSGSMQPVGTPVNVSGSSPRTITVTLSNFGQFTVGASDSPLPVTLSSFTSNVNGRNIKLSWSTQKESNNKGFEIQRSDVNSQAPEYTVIGFINGKGNSNNSVNYSFEDSKLSSGKYKYRLKQIDFNGNYEYFELSGNVEVGVPGKFTLSQNYPNPFNPMTKIDFSVPSDSRVNIKVFDASGREAGTLVNENKKAGYYTVTFNASGLSSGMYFCRMIANSSDNSFTSTQKMILVK